MEHLVGVRAQIDAVIGAIQAVLADHESLLQPVTAHLGRLRAPRREGVCDRVLQIVRESPGIKGCDVASKLGELGYAKPGARAGDHGVYQILGYLVAKQKLAKVGRGGYTIPRAEAPSVKPRSQARIANAHRSAGHSVAGVGSADRPKDLQPSSTAK